MLLKAHTTETLGEERGRGLLFWRLHVRGAATKTQHIIRDTLLGLLHGAALGNVKAVVILRGSRYRHGRSKEMGLDSKGMRLCSLLML